MPGQQQKSFNIGQIIYILSNKSQSVVPAIVAEENTHKVRKLDGIHEVVNYKLAIGPKDRQQMVPLSRVDGEVFTSIEEIRNTLVERLTSFVDDLVKTTKANVQGWYGITVDNQVLDEVVQESHEGEPKLDPEQIVNAVTHNVPINSTTRSHPLQLSGGVAQPSTRNQLRDNLRVLVGDSNVPDPGPSSVIMPDGTVIKVNLPEG